MAFKKYEVLSILEELKGFLEGRTPVRDGCGTKVYIQSRNEIPKDKVPEEWRFSREPYSKRSGHLHIPVPLNIMQEVMQRWREEKASAASTKAEEAAKIKREREALSAQNYEGLKVLVENLNEGGVPTRLEQVDPSPGHWGLFIHFTTEDGKMELRVGSSPLWCEDPKIVKVKIEEIRTCVARESLARRQYIGRFRNLLSRAREVEYQGWGDGNNRLWGQGEEEIHQTSRLMAAFPGQTFDYKSGKFSVGLATNGGTPTHSTFRDTPEDIVFWHDQIWVERWMNSWEAKILLLEQEKESLPQVIPTEGKIHAAYISRHVSGYGVVTFWGCATFLKQPIAIRTERLVLDFIDAAKLRGVVLYEEDPREFFRRCEVFGYLPEVKVHSIGENHTFSYGESPDERRAGGSYTLRVTVSYRYTYILGELLQKEKIQ